MRATMELRESSAHILRAAVAGWGACLLLGCGSATEPVQPIALRAIEPDAGSITSAGMPRVEIGSESRPVVLAQPRIVSHWREPVVLEGDSIEVAVARPADVPLESSVRARIAISAHEGDPTTGDAIDQRLADAGRRSFHVDALLVPGAERVQVDVAIPPAFRGLAGLMDIVLRPRPADAEQTFSLGPVTVRDGDELRFGFGIEDAATEPGSSIVEFTVSAEDSGIGNVKPVFARTLAPAGNPSDRGWQDARIDLSALAGRTVTLRIAQRVLGSDPSARSLAVIGNPLVVATRPAVPRSVPRNLVLISLDTLRAASLSSYGYARATTPRMDAELAARGTRVTRVLAPRPFTPPSHMTMLTGLDPCAHGVEGRHDVLGADHVTLAERLRAEGYDTAAFTEDAYVVSGAGFARGFDVYHELRSDESSSPGFGAETFGRAARWLETTDARPFFLFIHTYQVHAPYDPPEGYADLFDEPLPGDPVPAPNRAARDAYDSEIRYTDGLVGEFLAALAARGLADDTLVVVTSDHGEQFGEHFWTGHGFSTHDEAIRVPLLLRAPGLVPAGRVVEAQVGLVDLVPTVLDLLGLASDASLQGASFAGLIRDEDTAHAAPASSRPVFSAASGSESVATSRYKLMRSLNEENPWQRLFDLATDPGEKRDVASAHPDWVAEGHELLSARRSACGQWRDAHPTRSGESLRGSDQPDWLINRDEIEQKLRSLGYVE